MALCFSAPAAYANPTGAAVVNGSASFARSGSTLTVTNTPGAIINWQQFSIGQNEVTRFIQQSAASAVLNRVVGVNPSVILGTLTSNGRVFLVNPSGITIGRGAMIDVAGFTASTLHLSDADYLSGRLLFQGIGTEGKLINAGTIRAADGGQVYLVAPNVENQKDAVITSPKGEVVIAAGRKVELVNSREPDIRVEFVAPAGEAVNAGSIVASSGVIGIYGTVVRNSGFVSASRAVVGDGGKIVFRAAQDALLEAGSKVEATGDKGGTVQVLGNRVGVLDGASIDVSGDTGGGTVLVGGDFQGKNAEVPNAWRTYFGSEATIHADALLGGDGGKVILWADDITRAYGTISARGGAQGGNGGFVEVSGKVSLDFAARVNASAPLGAAGTLLLDPTNITVATGGGATTAQVDAFADAGGTLTISPATLNAAGTTVVLQATQDININNAVNLTTAGAGFVAQAGDDINVNATITTNNGRIHLEADSPHAPGGSNGSGQLAINAAVTSNGGKITLIGGGDNILAGGGIALSEGDVINAGAGGIDVALSGNASLGVGSLGILTQILGNPMDELHTTGALRIGVATTAGTNGLGAGAQSILATSVTNIYPGSAIDLTPASGTSFEIHAGTGGIVLDQPLTTFQPTTITTTGTLTINDPINTTNNPLTLIAPTVTVGANGSINTGSGACSGAACPVSTIVWDGLGDGSNWFDPLNWNLDRLPTAADEVTIGNAFGTILIGTGAAAANSLIANSGVQVSGTGSLTLDIASQFANSFTLTGGGTLSGAGSASVTGPNGTFTWSGGTMDAGGLFQLVSGRSGTLTNSLVLNRTFQNEGLLTLSNASISGSGSFANSGTLTAAAGTTNTISNAFQNISNTIAGTIQVNGALTMGNFPLNEGTISVAAGGTFSVGTLDNAATVTVDGTASIGTLTLTAGTVGGTGDLTVTTNYNEAGGALGTTFSDLSITKSGAFTVNGFTAVDTLKLIASGAVTLNGNVTVTAGTGDSLVISGTSFNAGTATLDPGGGRFLVWSANPASDDRGSLAYDFKQYNANFGSSTVLGTGDGFLYTVAPSITPGLTGTASKVYDAGTAATLATANFGASGAIDGDTVALSGSGAYTNKNVGTGKTVNATGIAIASATDGLATVYGYQLASSTASGNIGEISTASLTGSIAAASKVYDATTGATISGRSLSGVLGSDAVTYAGGTATFGDKNVANGKTVTAAGLGLTGTDAGNYTVNATATALADITPASLTGSITAANKVYDAGTGATISGRSLSGVLLSDAVTYTGGTATFDTKNVGTGKTVTGTGLGLTGTDAGNYTVNTTAVTTADVSAASLTGSITAANKTYDATTAATINGHSLAGILSSDAVSYTGGTATFDTKNVGTGKTVTGTGLSLTGADSGNYTVNTTAVTAADVTAASLTGSITASSKAYDAGTGATITGRSLSGVLLSDAVTYSGGAATFDTKNVGTGKTVNATGLSLTGVDAGNYLVNATATTTADVTPASLTGSVTAANKIYDASNAATINGHSLTGILGSDAVSYTGGTATFDTKNIGTGKTVTAAGLSLTGVDSGNYTVNTTAATTADVTPASLTGSITASNKVYDTTTAATISGRSLAGVLGSDVVTYNGGTATFDNKNVGTGKTVSATGLALLGADAGNYTVNTTAVTAADVTAASLTGSITASNKVYDAGTGAAITGRSLSGILGSDAVSYAGGTATFDTKNVGTGKTVTGTGLSLTGADAGNYTVNAFAVTTADVTPASLTGSITAANKVYDGNTSATIAGHSLSGILASDAVSYTGGTATFDNKNAGTGKTVSATGLSLTGADAGNYTVNTTAAATADVSQRPLVLTIGAQDKVYDGTTAVSLVYVDNRIAGDTLSVAYASAAFDNKDVGSAKPVSVAGINATGTDAANYTLGSSAVAAASITPASLTVTANDQSRTYGTTLSLNGTEFSASGLVAGETVGAVNLLYTGGVASVAGGPYPIIPSGGTGGTFSPGNYTMSYVNGQLTVTPATLTYLATAAGRTSGEPNQVFDGQVNGFVNGESLGTATSGTALWLSPADPSSLPGSYAINGSGLSALNGNYTFVQAASNAAALTILGGSPLPPAAVNPPPPAPPPNTPGPIVPDLGTGNLLNVSTGESVPVPQNSLPDPGIYLNQDGSSVMVVGQGNAATQLVFPTVNYAPGYYVNSETGFLYVINENTQLDPGVYYNRESQTVLVVSANSDGNVTVSSADVKESVQTVSAGVGGRRVASIACR